MPEVGFSYTDPPLIVLSSGQRKFTIVRLKIDEEEFNRWMQFTFADQEEALSLQKSLASTAKRADNAYSCETIRDGEILWVRKSHLKGEVPTNGGVG